MKLMDKIDLAFKHFSMPANVNRLLQGCEEAGDDICSRSSGKGDIPQFVPAEGRISWDLLNSVVQQVYSDRQPVFCEWGSGVGLVTLLASSIGMPATGIEIEEELINLSRDFSTEYSIPATFINGSIFPKHNQIPLFDYKKVDLFFVYPWPDQIVSMLNLFEQVAASGAVLICYHGGRNYRVIRR